MIYLNEFNDLYMEIIADLLTYNKVISRSNYKLQNKAINNKVQQLIHSNIQEVIYSSDNTNIIRTQFVYKTKCLVNNLIKKQKARLVVQGIY